MSTVVASVRTCSGGEAHGPVRVPLGEAAAVDRRGHGPLRAVRARDVAREPRGAALRAPAELGTEGLQFAARTSTSLAGGSGGRE